MAQYGGYRPKAIADHSASLMADFDNVYNTVEARSRVSKPPSDLRSQISKGITNGIAEIQSNRRYFRGWSDADKDSVTRILLDNIITETAAGPYESYHEPHTRFEARSPGTAAYNRLDGERAEDISNVAVVNGTRIVETKSYSATITLNIVHQASVNRMEGKDSHYLREAISVSIEVFFSDDWFRGTVRISGAWLLDSGDVEFVAHAEYRGDLERVIRSTAWHEGFETSLGPLPVQTYNVRMHNMRIGCMVFSNRKEKSTIIKTLADTNFPVESYDNTRSIIRDVYWGDKKPQKKREQRTTALMVEFSMPEQANKALANGLFWQGTPHACNIADPKRFAPPRCSICQNFGHLWQTCSAEPRCGYCAEPHLTDNCTSTKIECALCGGSHYSAGRECQVANQANKIRRFPTTVLPSAAEPVAEVQGVIKMEPDQTENMPDRTQNDYPTSEPLLQQPDDFRIVGTARDTELRSNALVRPKREAGDALPEAESGGETKRIKQEDLKQEESPRREDSMAPYRQPSPYIVYRPW